MHTADSFAKRIKRHVIGRQRNYFAVTSPGFEKICLRELTSPPLDMAQASAVSGGVEFEGRLDDCCLANLYLHTAGRILLRIQSFKASNFKQLAKKLAELPWELYLAEACRFRIHVTVRHCRLYHKDAIARRFSDSIAGAVSGAAVDDTRSPRLIPQRVFVRGTDDHFTVSIDSSGAHLHKRGLKIHSGPAPLRETIAAAALLLAGYRGAEPLVDPMCGTGTFSLEAALMAKNIPPGWFREFAFMGWPSFRPKNWQYIKRRCERQFTRQPTPDIFASDKDPTACRRLERTLTENRLSDAIQVVNRDFFDILPRDFTGRTGLVAINPPYGRRLENSSQSEQLFAQICARLKQEYKGWKVILISPSKHLAKKVPFPLQIHPLFHGGLKPVLMIGRIR